MRSLLTFALVAIVASTGFGQSVTKINAAVKAVQPAGAIPENPTAALSRGIIDAQGNVLANGKTGVLALAANTTIGGSSVSALGTITSTSADAFDVGPAGTTNPTFQVDASTASAATGLKIKSAASTGGLALSVISSGTNESLTLDAKGSGTITLNATGTGAIIASRTVTLSDATTPSMTTASGKTNTGYIQINGKTSGATKSTTADATAQTVTHNTAAQTSGAATVTIPDMAGVSATFSFNSTATLTAGATPAFAPGAAISTYLLTPGEDETIAATTTGATAGKVYFLRVLTSGSTSRTITFGSNFKSTGTLATGSRQRRFLSSVFCLMGRTSVRSVEQPPCEFDGA